MKSIFVITSFLLLVILLNTLTQPCHSNVNSQLVSDGVPIASEKNMFYNFTSNHLFVDDEDDWVFEGIDIRRTYVACDGRFIYIVWVTPETGSHAYEIYFDVGKKNGYPISIIKATYRFSSFEGFFKWNGTLWQSESGDIAHNLYYNIEERQEYWEVKIALSTLGSPPAIRLIHRILFAGVDQVPDNSLILIYLNQSQNFIASFYVKTSRFEGRLREIRKESIGYYGSEGFNASLKIMNFGNLTLDSISINLNLPEDSGSNLNETFWNLSLKPNESWNLQFKLRPERLGKFNLTATISSIESENTFSQTIPLDLLVIPKMDLSIQHLGEMSAGFDNKLNVTVVNHEARSAEVSVVTFGQFIEYWFFNPLTLELSPNSSVKVLTKIIPMAIINPEDTYHNYSFLEMALEFENSLICSSGAFQSGPIKIVEPNVRITLQYPKKVLVGETFHVNISAINDEDKEIMASFKVKVSGSSYAYKDQTIVPVLIFLGGSHYKEQITAISSGSNVTFSFKFKAVEEYPSGDSISFYVRHGSYGDYYYAGIKVVSLFINLRPIIQYTSILASLAITIGLAFFYWKRKKPVRGTEVILFLGMSFFALWLLITTIKPEFALIVNAVSLLALVVFFSLYIGYLITKRALERSS